MKEFHAIDITNNNGPSSTYGKTTSNVIKDEERKTFESIMKRVNTKVDTVCEEDG